MASSEDLRPSPRGEGSVRGEAHRVAASSAAQSGAQAITAFTPHPNSLPSGERGPETDPRVLVLSVHDNVGVAIRDIPAGETVTLRGVPARFEKAVPLGHKIALGPIAAGAKIV